MIRDATFSDIPAMAKLLKQSHERSKYAGRCGVSDKALEQLLTGLVAGQKQNGPGASFAQVATDQGKVVALMLGALNRVYNIGDKLCASDLFLVNTGKTGHAFKLMDNYIAWARSNPKVIEIGLSWSDSIPNSRGVTNIYKRMGGHFVGEQYAIDTDLDDGVVRSLVA
jgi:hypothetical protein